MFQQGKVTKGISNWRQPSLAQIGLLIAVFILPVFPMMYIEKNFQLVVLTIYRIAWIAASFIMFFYILIKAKGKEKKTILSVEALKGEFVISRSWHVYLAFYPAAGAIGALVNGYYLIAPALLLLSAAIFLTGRYIQKGFRIDESGNLFLVSNSGESAVNFLVVNKVESQINRMATEAVYKPLITLHFCSNMGDSGKNPLKLKFSPIRSKEFGTYVDPKLFIEYIRNKCEENGFVITYSAKHTLDWVAEKPY